jgi:hypothetical protein
MLYLYNSTSIAAALAGPLDPVLRRLLRERIATLGEELMAWTDLSVILPGDNEHDIIQTIGASPLTEPYDGIRFGQPGFHPHWDWLIDHGGWFEMCQSYGGSYGLLIFVQDVDGTLPALRRMCRQYCSAPPD